MKPGRVLEFFWRRITRGDKEAGLFALRELGSVVVPGYRWHFPQIGWWDNTAFNRFLARFQEEDSLNTDRKWMVAQLERLTRAVPGDTAECGVWRGASSWLLCNGNRSVGKTHHVFDSFEGLSAPGQGDGAHWTRGDLSFPETGVREGLREFTDVKYWKGWIPERFNEVSSLKFSFVHIDVDLEAPTHDSIAFFYPLLSDGAILLCDDYGFTTCPGATRACDEFLRDKPEKMLSLGGGGGFFIKGRQVAPQFGE
jgi:O-methyltransferase